MVTDKWLSAIGSATQVLFWAVGYFFGFTLVTALSFGVLLPGGFHEIGAHRKHAWHFIYKREGKYYLIAELVALTGWLFLSIINWIVFLICTAS